MKNILTILLCAFCAGSSMAQEALWGGSRVKSPVVNSDGTVTFSLFAPKASKVEVTGDFLPRRRVAVSPSDTVEAAGTVAMEEGSGGVWTYTTCALQPELYSYSFTVNGMKYLDPANIYVNRDIASLTSIFIVTGDKGDKGYMYSVNEVPHGNVSKVWYDSPALKMKRRMTVYTPAGYERGGRYPVLYLLHGAGGDEDAWSTLGRTAQILDNLIAACKAKPMIVVMPNGNPNCQAAPGEWSFGMYTPGFMGAGDGPKEAPAATMDESFMDIVRYIDANYRTQKGRTGRAVCGLSMGGGHTFSISRRYPTVFDYYGLFSAAVSVDKDFRFNTSLFEHMMQSEEFNAQMKRLFQSAPKLYWIAIGKTDFLYQNNADLRRYLDQKGYRYEYNETEGGHIWRNWRIYLADFAQRIFK